MLEMLRKTQYEYLQLLKNVKKGTTPDNFLNALDDIQIFWFKKRKLLDMASKYVFSNSETYFYTAVSHFNINDLDKNIFFLMGQYQVYDDPIISYLKVLKNRDNDDNFSAYLKKLNSIVLSSIEELIGLLEAFIPNFYILPLREHFSNQIQEKVDITQFLKYFFKKDINLKLLNQYDNINEIIDKVAISNIIFCEGDDPSHLLVERLKYYREKYQDIIPPNLNDIQLFTSILHAAFKQVFHVINTALYFCAYPFLDEFTIYNNFSIVINSMIYSNYDYNWQILVNKTKVMYMLYFEFKRRNANLTIADLRDKGEKIEWNSEFSKLENELDNTRSLTELIKNINKLLDLLLY